MSSIVALYLVGFAAFLVVCGMTGYWILQPIAKAVKGRRRPTRYSMVDFLWLSIMATTSLAPLSNFLAGENMADLAPVISMIAIMILTVVVIIWWRGIATLSGLGIDDHRRRGTFLLVVLPASIAVSLTGLPIVIVMFWYAMNGKGAELAFWFAGIGGLAALVLVARKACLWVLAGAVDSTGTVV